MDNYFFNNVKYVDSLNIIIYVILIGFNSTKILVSYELFFEEIQLLEQNKSNYYFIKNERNVYLETVEVKLKY